MLYNVLGKKQIKNPWSMLVPDHRTSNWEKLEWAQNNQKLLFGSDLNKNY